jgi:hypothetical protein
MLAKSTMLFVCVGGRRVGAAVVGTGKSGPRVERTVLEDVPEELDASDARAMGGWLREILDAAGVSASSAVLCLERKDVATKRLTFEHVDDPEAELPGMVRLQMLRQLSFPAEHAAIDYALLPAASGDESAGADQVVVRAVAAPGERLSHLRRVFEHAGLKPVRAGLSAEGVAHLLVRSGVTAGTESELIIAPGLDGVELIVVRDGRVAAARWHALAPTANTGDPASFFDLSVSSEARRTWMSDQLAESSTRINRVVILASPGASRDADQASAALADAISEDLSLPTVTVDPGGLVGVEGFDHRLTPVVGVASQHLDTSSGGARVDLLHPRQPPDRAAPVRKLVLVAALLLLVVLGGVWTLGNRREATLLRELERQRERQSQAAVERAAAVRDAARAEHVRRYMAGRVSPLAELDTLAGMLPGRERALLTGFRVGVGSETRFAADRRTRFYDPELWASVRQVRADMGVKAATRVDADRLRLSFVERPELYVETAGADGASTNDPRYPHRLELKIVQQSRDVRDDLAWLLGDGSGGGDAGDASAEAGVDGSAQVADESDARDVFRARAETDSVAGGSADEGVSP